MIRIREWMNWIEDCPCNCGCDGYTVNHGIRCVACSQDKHGKKKEA